MLYTHCPANGLTTSPTMPNEPTIIPSCQSAPPRSITYNGMSVNIAVYDAKMQ